MLISLENENGSSQIFNPIAILHMDWSLIRMLVANRHISLIPWAFHIVAVSLFCILMKILQARFFELCQRECILKTATRRSNKAFNRHIYIYTLSVKHMVARSHTQCSSRENTKTISKLVWFRFTQFDDPIWDSGFRTLISCCRVHPWDQMSRIPL